MAFPFQFLLETVLLPLLMAKDKKKHSKKDQVSEDLLEVAALSLKKFRKVTKEIGKLSTGQKLVGGLALVAVGLLYLAEKETENTTPAHPAPDAPLLLGIGKHDNDDAEEAESAGPATPHRKPRKTTRAK
ncbi:MAG: hypothetical protein NVSMB30_16680 [Hymenobacter sp.]